MRENHTRNIPETCNRKRPFWLFNDLTRTSRPMMTSHCVCAQHTLSEPRQAAGGVKSFIWQSLGGKEP